MFVILLGIDQNLYCLEGIRNYLVSSPSIIVFYIRKKVIIIIIPSNLNFKSGMQLLSKLFN